MIQVTSSSKPINVQRGDILGVHYTQLTNVAGAGIIPYADSRYPLCCGLVHLSRVYTQMDGDDATFPLGVNKTFDPNDDGNNGKGVYRSLALVAYVEPFESG